MLPCCHVDFWRPRLPWASLCTVENSSSGPIAGGLQHWMGPLLGRLRMQLNHPALGMCNTSNIPRNHLNRFVSRLHEASPAKTLYSSLPVDALDTECLKRNCAKDLTHDSGRGNDSETVPKKVKLQHNSSWGGSLWTPDDGFNMFQSGPFPLLLITWMWRFQQKLSYKWWTFHWHVETTRV